MPDDDDDFVPVEECAARMGISVERVEELVAQKVLRARRFGGWALEVQPALVTGVTDAPKKRQRKPRSRP